MQSCTPSETRNSVPQSLHSSILNSHRKRPLQDVEENGTRAINEGTEKRTKQEEDGQRLQFGCVQDLPTPQKARSSAEDEAESERGNNCKRWGIISTETNETTPEGVDVTVDSDCDLEEREIREERPEVSPVSICIQASYSGVSTTNCNRVLLRRASLRRFLYKLTSEHLNSKLRTSTLPTSKLSKTIDRLPLQSTLRILLLSSTLRSPLLLRAYSSDNLHLLLHNL